MTLLLDTSVLIGQERNGLNARQALQTVASAYPQDLIALSVITVAELNHGVYRATLPQRAEFRRRFLDETLSVVPVVPVTVDIALRAGQIDAIAARDGLRLPFADLLIGATALHTGSVVATGNIRHFSRIPGLQIVRL